MVAAINSNQGKDGSEPDKSGNVIVRPRGEPVWVPAYLAALAITGKYVASAEAAGTAFSTVWDYRQDCQQFVAAEAKAVAMAAAALEDEVRRRAYEGLRRYKFTKGGDPIIDPRTGEPYFELEYSDPLLMRSLEKHETGSWVPQKRLDHHAGGAVFTTAADRKKELESARQAKLSGGLPVAISDETDPKVIETEAKSAEAVDNQA